MKKKNNYLKELEAKYKEQDERRKEKIRATPSKFKRFWKWVWYFIAFPWIWLFYNIRDWRSAICGVISLLLWSSSVWGFYLASLLCGWKSTEAGLWLFGIGTTVWIWWASPVGSPFILLVTMTAIGMKMIFDKIKRRKN
jgi:hypothetical protein